MAQTNNLVFGTNEPSTARAAPRGRGARGTSRRGSGVRVRGGILRGGANGIVGEGGAEHAARAQQPVGEGGADSAARAQQPPRELGDVPLARRRTAGLTLAEVQHEEAKSALRTAWLIEEKKKVDLEKSKLEESKSTTN